MSTQTKKTLAIIGGALGIALISAFATISVQALYKQHETPPPSAPVAVAPTPPSPPVAQVVAVNPHYVTKSYPVRNCYPTQNVVYQDSKQGIPGAGAVIGGVAGGLQVQQFMVTLETWR